MASPFLQYIAEFMYARRYAKRTVDGDVHRIKMYILFNKKARVRGLVAFCC